MLSSTTAKQSRDDGETTRSSRQSKQDAVSQRVQPNQMVGHDVPRRDASALSVASIQTLQRTYGNTTVSRLLQPKLTVGPVGDGYEQEADRVAAKVVQTTNQSGTRPAQRQTDDEELQMKPLATTITRIVQRQAEEEVQMSAPGASAEGGPVSADVEDAIQRAKGGGRPLAEGLRTKMESGFGTDFSSVRVHDDSRADALNRSLHARAFTTGKDIFFKQGAYNAESDEGQKLVAHELTHVLQQGGVAQRKPAIQRNGGTGDAPAPTVGATAQKIANGHAYSKHVQTQGEYPEITSKAQFAQLVDQVMSNPSESKALSGGRTAYWHDSKKTIVIVDPKNPDGGTAFRPTAGKSYYNKQV